MDSPALLWKGGLILGAYLLGSCLFSRWIPLLLRGVDICAAAEDGNPGATNVIRRCGWGLGLLCLGLDLAKGFFPVAASLRLTGPQSWFPPAMMVAVVLGHAFPVFSRFQGGKCIAAIFGEMLGLLFVSPVGLVLAALYIALSTVLRVDPRRRRSILTFSLFLALSLPLEIRLGQLPIGVGCALVSLVSIFKHWQDRSPGGAPALRKS